MGDAAVLPEPEADIEGLVEPGAAAVEIDRGGFPLLPEPPRPDAELEPTAGCDVERRHRAGGDERMPEATLVHVCTEAEPLVSPASIARYTIGSNTGDVGSMGNLPSGYWVMSNRVGSTRCSDSHTDSYPPARPPPRSAARSRAVP